MSLSAQKKGEEKSSFIKTLVNIASIVSATITSSRLYLMGVFSFKMTVISILSVVVFVALGNNIAKILLAFAALFLFVLLYGSDSKECFYELMYSMITLIFLLGGFYIVIRGLFGGNK